VELPGVYTSKASRAAIFNYKEPIELMDLDVDYARRLHDKWNNGGKGVNYFLNIEEDVAYIPLNKFVGNTKS
jgi:hypothetical protein